MKGTVTLCLYSVGKYPAYFMFLFQFIMPAFALDKLDIIKLITEFISENDSL